MTKENWDWYDFLARAKAGTTDADERVMALRLAVDWTTCACGQLCKDLPRDSNGSPRDPILHDLGTCFYLHLSSCEWAAAEDILHEIEARSALLLRKMAARNTPKDSFEATSAFDELMETDHWYLFVLDRLAALNKPARHMCSPKLEDVLAFRAYQQELRKLSKERSENIRKI